MMRALVLPALAGVVALVFACGVTADPIADAVAPEHDAGDDDAPTTTVPSVHDDAGVDADAPSPCEPLTYYRDSDSDGYGSGDAVRMCEADADAGWSRFSGDCNDEDPRANPSQDQYQAGEPGDFDCDGDIQFEHFKTVTCTDMGAAGTLCRTLSGQLPAWNKPPSTSKTPPGCGQTGEWVTACGLKLDGGGCALVVEQRTQRCL